MHQRLREIIREKQKEVARLKKESLDFRDDTAPTIRDFKSAISVQERISLIAEIKFASPSAGIISEKTDANLIGRTYEKAGASAISLITDNKFFKGNLKNLPKLKKVVSIPILRKDFIIDRLQVLEARTYGSDAILLIARILSPEQLRELISVCSETGMTPLTEVHDRDDLEKAIDCGAEVIGINNRDLDTFEVDINTTFELAPLVPKGIVLVSESGIEDGRAVQALKGTGVQAVLVGSSLMKSNDPAEKTGEIVKAGYGAGDL
ncbi:indole-3-glycerol phosphate synthase TrpC [Thermodesulfobacteriota bacterium]